MPDFAVPPRGFPPPSAEPAEARLALRDGAIALSDALRAVASAASPLTRSTQPRRNPLRRPFRANTSPVGDKVSVYSCPPISSSRLSGPSSFVVKAAHRDCEQIESVGIAQDVEGSADSPGFMSDIGRKTGRQLPHACMSRKRLAGVQPAVRQRTQGVL